MEGTITTRTLGGILWPRESRPLSPLWTPEGIDKAGHPGAGVAPGGPQSCLQPLPRWPLEIAPPEASGAAPYASQHNSLAHRDTLALHTFRERTRGCQEAITSHAATSDASSQANEVVRLLPLASALAS